MSKCFFFFKQKTAYEIVPCDWSSDVCSSDLPLGEILYDRTEGEFRRGTFRVRGDVIEVCPTYDDYAYRIELWGDEVESLSQIDPLTGQVRQTYLRLPIYPKTHYVMSRE